MGRGVMAVSLRRTMSVSIAVMASEIRCLLFQKPRKLSCTIVIMLKATVWSRSFLRNCSGSLGESA